MLYTRIDFSKGYWIKLFFQTRLPRSFRDVPLLLVRNILKSCCCWPPCRLNVPYSLLPLYFSYRNHITGRRQRSLCAKIFCVQIYFVFIHCDAHTRTFIKRICVIIMCMMCMHKTHWRCCGVYAGSMSFPWRRRRTDNNNSNNYYYTPTRCRKLDDVYISSYIWIYLLPLFLYI